MFTKLLIANRGEIACRIARTARRMGIACATIHSAADANALHVREIGESVLVGDAPARASYLNIAAVVAAAKQVGADAVHPGFGFLSENAAFADACAKAGLAFIGPSPEVLALFGDKAAAKKLARSLDIPVAPGLETPSDDVEALLRATASLPLPFILKAVGGGGGKGMRVVRDRAGLRDAVEAAIREGRSAFGDGRLIAEAYLAAPRHVEVQILGNGRGDVLHLFDRECSLQRRYQKVVEEAPVASVPQALRERLWAHAIALARATKYLGLGTVEFAVTGDSAVFLEVNPRLQVEHPVTEAVTGLDLVQLQIEIVARRELPFAQSGLQEPKGHAVQARLYAEDPARGFLPATGRLVAFDAPTSLRVDAGVATGDEVTPHYDPMIAKLIAHAPARDEALARLGDALRQTRVLGIASNRAFLAALLADPRVVANEVSTEFIDAWLAEQPASRVPGRDVAALAALWLHGQRAIVRDGAWGDPGLTGWRVARGLQAALPTHTLLASAGDELWRIGMAARRIRVDDAVHDVHIGAGDVRVDDQPLRLDPVVDGDTLHASFPTHDLSLTFRPLHDARRGSATAEQGGVRAPMMGIVIQVLATEGQQVQAGDRLATLESMKMELAITAPHAGVVARVGCAPQAKVERHQELFRIDPVAA